MKHTLFLFLLLLAGKHLHAQENAPVCGIYYDYDAVGQRIKRFYDCKAPPGGGDPNPSYPPGSASRMAPPGQGKILSTNIEASETQVYPNPTSGPYTIALSDMPKEPLHYHWYNERGQILGSGIITEQKTTGNISAWADGMYLLQIYLPAGTAAFRIIKITSVH